MSKPSLNHEIIAHPIYDQAVRQRVENGYIAVSDVCRAAGKQFKDYHRLKRTKRFLTRLSADTGILPSELIQQVRGGYPHLQGTWVHPRVAVDLGQWLSDDFRVWVTGIVDNWKKIQAFLRQSPAEWTKRYPDLLWMEIYRLHGWAWAGMGKNRNQECGRIVNDLIYDRIAPGLRESIEARVPRLPNGEHRVLMHQLFTEAVGIAALERHIALVLHLMSLHSDWRIFMFAANHLFPKSGRHLPPPPPKPPSSQGSFL